MIKGRNREGRIKRKKRDNRRGRKELGEKNELKKNKKRNIKERIECEVNVNGRKKNRNVGK